MTDEISLHLLVLHYYFEWKRDPKNTEWQLVTVGAKTDIPMAEVQWWLYYS